MLPDLTPKDAVAVHGPPDFEETAAETFWRNEARRYRKLHAAEVEANAELLAEIDRLKGEWDELNGLRLDAEQRLVAATAALDAARLDLDNTTNHLEIAEAALGEARLDIALHTEAAHRFQADADVAREERSEEALLRIGAEVKAEAFRDERDDARGLAAALEAELARVRAFAELLSAPTARELLNILDSATIVDAAP